MNAKIILSGLIAVLLLAGTAGAIDQVSIDSVTAYPGGTAVLPISFVNDSALGAIEVVVEYDTMSMRIDSFSTLGGRLDYIENDEISFNDSAQYIDLWLSDWSGYIQPGSGLMANLFFTVSSGAAGNTIVVDSTHWPTGDLRQISTRYSVGASAKTVIPEFEKGYVTVLGAPPTDDSVWVDSVGAIAGTQAELYIYGKNEESIREIDLSLYYTSDDLLYDHVEFDGTRGLSATSVVEANAGMRQVHINLEYGDASPLTAGSGPLAKVVFDVSAAAPAGLAVIDSISYLGVTPMKFHQTASAGELSFAPYFKKGFVHIKLTTDIEDDNPSALPTDYALYQNTPNPFNPTTEISFDLPKSSHVKLDVLNILGQRVLTLIDKTLPAGKHTVTFDTKRDASELATGVYFYKLDTEDYTQSRKMLLLK